MMEPRHIDALAHILGDKGLVTAASDMVAYETGARYDQGRAAFVARPASTADVSAVVAYCVKNGIALVPQSGNTGLVSGSTPDGSGQEDAIREIWKKDVEK